MPSSSRCWSAIARGAEPALTGDSLLVGDVGRPDFGGGGAAAQYVSMLRLLELPEWVALLPAALFLAQMRIARVTNFAGGTATWRGAGMPLVATGAPL